MFPSISFPLRAADVVAADLDYCCASFPTSLSGCRARGCAADRRRAAFWVLPGSDAARVEPSCAPGDRFRVDGRRQLCSRRPGLDRRPYRRSLASRCTHDYGRRCLITLATSITTFCAPRSRRPRFIAASDRHDGRQCHRPSTPSRAEPTVSATGRHAIEASYSFPAAKFTAIPSLTAIPTPESVPGTSLVDRSARMLRRVEAFW